MPLPNASVMREIIDRGHLEHHHVATDSSTPIPGVRKIKGIHKVVTKNEMTMDDYQDILTKLETKRHTMHCIRSRNHHLFIEQREKISLSILEDKRLVSV